MAPSMVDSAVSWLGGTEIRLGLYGTTCRRLLPDSGVPVDYVFDGFESCMSQCLMGRDVVLLCDEGCIDIVMSKIRRLEDFGTVVETKVQRSVHPSGARIESR